jgi:hypothetical protein
MARASTPQQRRIATGKKFAAALEKAADAATEFIRARVECADDPRAGQPNDGIVILRHEMRELAGHLETTLENGA